MPSVLYGDVVLIAEVIPADLARIAVVAGVTSSFSSIKTVLTELATALYRVTFP